MEAHLGYLAEATVESVRQPAVLPYDELTYLGAVGTSLEVMVGAPADNAEAGVEKKSLLLFPAAEGEPRDFAITFDDIKYAAQQVGRNGGGNLATRTYNSLAQNVDPAHIRKIGDHYGQRIFSHAELRRITAKPEGSGRQKSIIESYINAGITMAQVVELAVSRKEIEIGTLTR